MKARTVTAIAAAGALAAAIGASWTQPASAGIECRGNFQVSEYGLINTPYCEDEYLAKVAREYGMNVSASAIRRNPGVKARACRLAGRDNRVRNTCRQYLPENNNRRIFLR